MIITNNPRFHELNNKNLVVEYYDISAPQLLLLVRNYVHKNHIILTHPLHSSLKPNETPYRSVVISNHADSAVDFESVSLIENAIATYDKFLLDKEVEIREEYILKDYQTIDYDLITKAME